MEPIQEISCTADSNKTKLNFADEENLKMENKLPLIKSDGECETSTLLRPPQKWISYVIDVNLLKNPVVHIYCLAQSIALLAMYIPLDFLPDMMIHEHNIPRIDAGNIIPIFGIGSIIGRILSGVCINYVKNSSIAVCSINFILLGGCCIGYVFCSNYASFIVLSCFNGIFFGSTFVLIPLTLLELFGMGSLTDTYGLVMLSSGITITFGLPILGGLIHRFNTYAAAFYVASGFYVLSGFLSVLILFLQYRERF